MDDLDYEELQGWSEYFQRRPIGWREDNRAAIISMSFGGGKTKPEDLFESLRVIKQTSTESKSSLVGAKFMERFKNKMTEEITF